MTVSVIVPLYYGRNFICRIIRQIEDAAERIYDSSVELIFVNDEPGQVIDKEYVLSGIIDVCVLHNDRNYGIQASRIRGLEIATGEYIHFFDQDDIITPNFYKSQLKAIGDADAVYCRCYNGNRQPYNCDRVFETAFEREKLLSVCPVISPGQVLIKRQSIPEFWKINILENIGSDDYLLWLCMYANGCSFVPNQDILYTHTRNGSNYSSDILRTKKSDIEMVEVLLESGMFNEVDKGELKKLPERQLVRRYAPQMKDQVVLMVLSELLECYEHGITLEDYLEKLEVERVAVFGAAIMGERIKGLLKQSDICVSFFIDKNAAFIKEDIPVFTLEDAPRDVDAVIISNISGEEEIKKLISINYDCPVFDIRTIVDEMKQK